MYRFKLVFENYLFTSTNFQFINVYFCYMWKWLILTILVSFRLQAQTSYNSCDQALELCPNKTFEVNNYGANRTVCGGCEDDFTMCFTPINSIWMKFTTNEVGGTATVDFSNVNMTIENGRDTRYNAVVFSANVPCNSVSYIPVGNCINGIAGGGQINLTNLAPNTTYYLCVSGGMTGGFTLPAEFEMSIRVLGQAVDRPQSFVFVSWNTNYCSDEPLYALAGTGDCPDKGSFYWYMNDELIAVTQDSILYTNNFVDGGVLRVEVSCYGQCPDVVQFVSDTIRISEFIIDAGPDRVITQGGSTQLESVIPANSTILWTPTYGLSNPYVNFPIADPTTTTTYTLTVTDTLTGCSMVDYVTVTVLDGIVIPNTFSPNGDGQNDTWYIKGLEAYPDNEIKIFTRWGQVVYQARNFNELKAWDGKIKLGDVTESVFFYVLKLNDSEGTEFNGSITLLR